MTHLRHIGGGVFEDIAGGQEPLYSRVLHNGETAYLHQSGYGLLPASCVALV
jgi:hypothetical protein